MMSYSTFEEELDAIRVEIYEEIKNMTHEEKIAYLKAQTEPIHAQYGIRVIDECYTGAMQ